MALKGLAPSGRFLTPEENRKYFESMRAYQGQPAPTSPPVSININDPEISSTANALQSAESQAAYLKKVYEAQKNYLGSMSGQQPAPTPTQTQPYQDSLVYTQDEWDRWNQNLTDAKNNLSSYQQSKPGYVPSSYNPPPPQQTGPVPSGYTGFWNNTPYAGGTQQTAGGGFTPDGSYSAGYHGSGPRIDAGPADIYVNGTVQTRGGGFTPDGSYSAGYHGSGEHPEITGESTPGEYRSGSFGPIIKPDLSNAGKVGDFLRYVAKMGYDVSKVDKADIEKQYHQSGGNFDGLSFLRTLPQPEAEKTELISQYSQNPMMPTAQVHSMLGGSSFPNLFRMGQSPSSPIPPEAVSPITPQPAQATPQNIGGPQITSDTSKPTALSQSKNDFTSLVGSAIFGSQFDDYVKSLKGY